MKVTLLTPDSMTWPMGTGESVPLYHCGMGSYPRSFKVDPYPAYTHDLGLVETMASQCAEVFPLADARVGIWLLSHEFIDRFNGITFEDYIYKREDGTDWEDVIKCHCGCGENLKFQGQALTIALAGKRIPPMPSMTRYLVAHEYGHAVFDYIARKLGYRDHEADKLQAKYMEMRGIEDYAKKYSGGRWHQSPAEIIANDFRILFTKQEIEFWPHDCPLPNWFDETVCEFWLPALKICQLDERAANIESFIHGKKKN